MKKIKNKWVTKNTETRLYHIPVPIIGLTGGIGTGKSSVTDILRKKNIPIIDADQLVKNIYQKDETKSFIATHFPAVINNDTIMFPKLREIVFRDPKAQILIENFIYAALPSEFKKTYLTLKNPSFIVYDVPLLFEKNLDTLVDFSLCVYAPKEMQIERVLQRDHSSKELITQIIDKQMDIEKKKERAQFVIENTAGLNELKKSVEQWLEKIF